MSEKFKLYKNIETFIEGDCAYTKNSPFVATFHKENDKILKRLRFERINQMTEIICDVINAGDNSNFRHGYNSYR